MPEDNGCAFALKKCLDNGTPKAWESFLVLAQPVIASAVVRALSRWGRKPSEMADDLIQDTFVKLYARDCHVLKNFRGNDSTSLCVYLRTIAASVVADHLNTGSAIKHGGKVQSISLDEAPAMAVQDAPLQKIETNIILGRVETCLSSYKERDRSIFWLYHRHGYTPDAISRYPGIKVGKGGVETIIYRLTKAIRDCVNKGSVAERSLEGAGA